MKSVLIIILGLFFWGTAVATAETTGLIGYWNFDEVPGWEVQDSSGNDHYGYIGHGLSGVAGQSQYGLLFDGNGDYVNMGDLADFDFEANDSFTLSAWIKFDNDIKDYHVIIGKASNFSINGYMLRHETNGALSMNIEASDDTAQANAVAWQDYRDGNWHHVIGVINRSDQTNTIYVDGFQKNQVNISHIGSLVNSYSFNIGSLENGGVSFKGILDEIMVYNRALSFESLIYPHGSLLQANNSYKVYYINSNGEKDWIINEEVFKSYDNKWEDVIKVDPQVLEQYPTQVKND